MGLDYTCRKKDKRLLVLLALGAFIMFSDICTPDDSTSFVHSYSWLEVQGYKKRVYRVDLTDYPAHLAVNRLLVNRESTLVHINKPMADRLKQGRALAIQKKRGGSDLTYTQVSPNLSFILGQPFSMNIANSDELALIPGIGPVLAGRIITYRNVHGPVKDAGQMEAITGIGPRMKQRLQKYFTYSIASE